MLYFIFAFYFFTQNTWHGGPGQNNFLDSTRFSSSYSIDYSSPGIIKLKANKIQFDTLVVNTFQTLGGWTDAVSFSFTPSLDGNYLVYVYSELGAQLTNEVEWRVRLNNQEIARQGTHGRSNIFLSVHTFKIGTFTAGNTYSITVSFRSLSNTRRAYLRNIRIIVRKIENYYYTEDETETIGSNTTYQTKLSLNFSNTNTDTFVVLSQVEFNASRNSYPCFIRTLTDGVDKGSESVKFSWSNTVRYPYFYVKREILNPGNHNIRIQYRTSNPVAQIRVRRARILVINKKEFFNIYESTSEIESSTNSTTDVQKVSLNITLTDTTKFILFTNSYLASQRFLWIWVLSYYVEAKVFVDGNLYSDVIYFPGFFIRNPQREFFTFSFGTFIKLPPGNHNVKITYRTLNSLYTAYIKNARIYLLEIEKSIPSDSGELLSSIFDTGEYGESRYGKIFYNATIPPGSKIKFKIAGSNDGVNFKWFGPDGTDTSWYRFNGEYLSDSLYGKRYIRYKVRMEGALSSPVLEQIRILYFKDYYVDNPEGSDLNFGTRVSPFLTIQKALSMMGKGDGCILKNGIYNEGDLFLDSTKSGYSKEFKTFFKNFQSDTPIIDASSLYSFIFMDSSASNILIEGIKLKSAILSNIYIKDGKNIHIKNNKFLIFDGSYGVITENVDSLEIKGNLFKNDIGSTYPFDGIWLYNSRNSVLDSNTVYNTADNGISLFYSQGVKLTRNLIYDVYAAGILFYESKGCKIYNNTIDSAESGIYMLRTRGNIIALNNSITNCKYGFNWVDGFGIIQVDYNNLWNNISNYTSNQGYSVTPGPNDIYYDPQFNPDYTLKPTSPLIDSGVYVGLPYYGSAPDIGAKEYGFPFINWNKKERAFSTPNFIYESDGTSFILGPSSNSSVLLIERGEKTKEFVFLDGYPKRWEILKGKIKESGTEFSPIDTGIEDVYYPYIVKQNDSTIHILYTKYFPNPQIIKKRYQNGVCIDSNIIAQGYMPRAFLKNDTLYVFFLRDSLSKKNLYLLKGDSPKKLLYGYISDYSVLDYNEIILISIEEKGKIRNLIYKNGNINTITISDTQKVSKYPLLKHQNGEIYTFFIEKNSLLYKISKDGGNSYSITREIPGNFISYNVSENDTSLIFIGCKYISPFNSSIVIYSIKDSFRFLKEFDIDGLNIYPSSIIDKDTLYIFISNNLEGEFNLSILKIPLFSTFIGERNKFNINKNFFVLNIVKDGVLNIYSPDEGKFDIGVYDVSGRELLRFKNKILKQGFNKIRTDLKKGVYFICIKGVKRKHKTKIILIK